jgi:hypothetical protein
LAPSRGEEPGTGGDELPAQPEAVKAEVNPPAASWQRHVLGTDEALEQFDREHPELLPPQRREAPETDPAGGHSAIPVPARQAMPPPQSAATREDRRLEVTDAAIELWHGAVPVAVEGFTRRVNTTHQKSNGRVGATHQKSNGRVGATHQKRNGMRMGLVGFTHPTKIEARFDISAALAVAATVGRALSFRYAGRRAGFRLGVAPTGRTCPSRSMSWGHEIGCG